MFVLVIKGRMFKNTLRAFASFTAINAEKFCKLLRSKRKRSVRRNPSFSANLGSNLIWLVGSSFNSCLKNSVCSYSSKACRKNPFANIFWSTSFAACNISIAEANSARAKSKYTTSRFLKPFCLLVSVSFTRTCLNIFFVYSALLITVLLRSFNADASADSAFRCFSYIPFGSTSNYISLPANKDFCYRFGDEYVGIRTGNFGGKLLFEGPNAKDLGSAIAFGDSQLLGLEWGVNSPHPHHLNKMLPQKQIIAYAAPNNGPLETIARIQKGHFEVDETTEALIFGFNIGTDIFRLSDRWAPSLKVPLQDEELERIFDFPSLFEILILRARLSGILVGESKNTPEDLGTLYSTVPKVQHERNLLRWLTKLDGALAKQLKLYPKMKIILVIYRPYWEDSLVSKGHKSLRNSVEHLVCFIGQQNFFDEVYLMKKSDEARLTSDRRHFTNDSISFEVPNCINFDALDSIVLE